LFESYQNTCADFVLAEYANSKRKPRIRLHTILNGWVVIRGENKKGLFFFV
jgi:hypothetical protein